MANNNFNGATLTGQDGSSVPFDFNPAAIVISHSVTAHSSAGKKNKPGTTQGSPQSGNGGGISSSGGINVAGTFEAMTAAAGVTTIALRQVTFYGLDVRPHCEQLYNWTVLQKSPAASGSGADQSTQSEKLPDLTFNWGSQTYSPVTLNQVTINYTRFTPDGTPMRAVVDMTLNLNGNSLTPTNPTSGGLPGRRSHVLTGAETLAGLSTQTYGNPGRWRQIATANGIQDPMRVQPGMRLYLPSAEEKER